MDARRTERAIHIELLKFRAFVPEYPLALVRDATYWVRIDYFPHMGLGQPACPEIDAGVHRCYLIGW